MMRRFGMPVLALSLALLLWVTWDVGNVGHRPDSSATEPIVAASAGSAHAAPSPVVSSEEQAAKYESTKFHVSGGTVRIDFDRATADALGIRFLARGASEETSDGRSVTFDIDPLSDFSLSSTDKTFDTRAGSRLGTKGALCVDRIGDREVIGNMALVVDETGRYTIVDTLNDEIGDRQVFHVSSLMFDFFAPTLDLHILGELTVTEEWANGIGRPDWQDAHVGVLTVEAVVTPVIEGVGDASGTCSVQAGTSSALAEPIGPDVIVGDLQSVRYYGQVGDIHAYAVGTYACNIGDARANWISHTNQHPIILQNMYRLKDDKFEQIGMAWIKHGFYAVSWVLCGDEDICSDQTNGTQLGVGCADPYSSSLNGAQSNMSLLSGDPGCGLVPASLCEVNPYTGYFPYPWTPTEYEPTIGKRLQVYKDDLDPALNVGAQYFIQGHYITRDDAAAGNAENNASYRPVEVTEASENNYPVTPIGSTVRTEPVVRAWHAQDPTVVETDIHVPGEGLFILGAKAIDLNNGQFRYSYALQNLNSARCAASFSIPLPDGVVVDNVAFHDIDYHSGEVYDGTDWTHVFADGAITWSTVPYETNPYANALRYNTLYSFYFDANVSPSATTIRMGLFRPGNPMELQAASVGPSTGLIDCNINGVADQCDLDCNAEGCAWPCGGSVDCNDNGAPDECEPDCNENNVADTCDITDLTSNDCNSNAVPDECEIDCDGNGIPEDCVPPDDSDLDGIDDCGDLCPLTTPEGYCACPLVGECCWLDGFWCLPDYRPSECIEAGGVPECLAAPCRQGCLLGDFDGDGDLDLRDFAALQRGFGDAPVQDYSLVFDFDEDEDIDLEDYESFTVWQSAPK